MIEQNVPPIYSPIQKPENDEAELRALLPKRTMLAYQLLMSTLSLKNEDLVVDSNVTDTRIKDQYMTEVSISLQDTQTVDDYWELIKAATRLQAVIENEIGQDAVYLPTYRKRVAELQRISDAEQTIIADLEASNIEKADAWLSNLFQSDVVEEEAKK